MDRKKTIIALILGSSIMACSSNHQVDTQVVVEPISYSQLCCTKFSELPWIQLSTNEELKFKFDDTVDAAAFKDGNSYFYAFQFADRSGSVDVDLASIMKGKEVFAPKLITLDHNYNIVSESQLAQFDVITSDAFTRTQYASKFKIDARKTPYIVIYTPETYLGETIQVDHPAKVRAKEFGEVMPMTTDPRYTHTYNGEVVLGVKTNTYKPASKKENQPTIAKSMAIETSAVASVLPETVTYYHQSIENAVKINDIPKALALLDEAKALNIEGAQKTFVNAINSQKIGDN